MAYPGTFFDLTIESNRRKFINADLSAVDLQPNAASVTGSIPPVFLSVETGLAADFLTNYGTGGAWALIGGTPPLTIQPAYCLLPPVGSLTGVQATGQVGDLTVVTGGINLIGVQAIAELGNVIGTITKMQMTFLEAKSIPLEEDHIITLRWSDDAGNTWSNGVQRTLGAAGEYFTAPTWWRLGMSRNRVFEVSWSSPVATGLQGVFISVTVANT